MSNGRAWHAILSQLTYEAEVCDVEPFLSLCVCNKALCWSVALR